MIKEAVAMKLQKKCRDQLIFRRLDFSHNTVAHFSLALLKSRQAAKKRRSDKPKSFWKDFKRFMLPETDCQNYLVFFCRTFLNNNTISVER